MVLRQWKKIVIMGCRFEEMYTPNMNTAETNIVSGINYYNSVTKMKFSLKLKEYLEVVIDSDSTRVN